MNTKKIFFSTLVAIISVLALSTVVIAAVTLNPLGAPNPAVGTMKTIEDIYQRLTAGTVAGAHTLNPILGPTTGTMHTLSEVYDVIPSYTWSDARGSGDSWAGDTWDEAVSYCASLENGSRLPTIGELNKAIANQHLEGGLVPGGFTSGLSYWSNTTNDTSAYTATAVTSTSVSATLSLKDATTVWYRCVR